MLQAVPSVASDERRLMPLAVAAKRLCLSERYLRKLAARGLVKVVRFGKKPLIATGEVDRLEKEGAPKP